MTWTRRHGKALAKWLLSTDDFDAEKAVSSPAIAASSLVPEQFVESVDVLKYILESRRMYDLQSEEIQRHLLLLGYPRKQIERLNPAKERVYAQYMRFNAL